jgi:hypothetical protein
MNGSEMGEPEVNEPEVVYFEELGGFVFQASLGSKFINPITNQGPIVILGSSGILNSSFDLSLIQQAQIYQAFGIHCLLFDYYSTGISKGEIKHAITFGRQAEDWKTAIRYVRCLPFVDENKIILSTAGISCIHILKMACDIKNDIFLVLAQTPLFDKHRFLRNLRSKRGALSTLSLSYTIAKDSVRELLGVAPIYVPLIARESSNEPALYKYNEMYDQCVIPGLHALKLQSSNPTFDNTENHEENLRNDSNLTLVGGDNRHYSDLEMEKISAQIYRVPARIILSFIAADVHIPIEKLRAPCLFQFMSNDDIFDTTITERNVMRNVTKITPKKYEGRHWQQFQNSEGSVWMDILSDQLAFMEVHLRN